MPQKHCCYENVGCNGADLGVVTETVVAEGSKMHYYSSLKVDHWLLLQLWQRPLNSPNELYYFVDC